MQVIGSAKGGFILQVTAEEMKKLVGIDPTEIKNGRDYPIEKIWLMLDGVRQARKKLLESAQRLTDAAGLLLREDPLFAEVTKNP